MTTLPQKELFRLDEVARYLDVSRATLYRWIDQGIPGNGQLEVIKVGKGLRIKRATILKIHKKRQ